MDFERFCSELETESSLLLLKKNNFYFFYFKIILFCFCIFRLKAQSKINFKK